ncbi:MAG: hypothetical protein AAF408_03360 [Pseudomonadota bacterium]
MSSDMPQIQVRQRRVFYIPGYDPIHSRRYRELYRKESTQQARISGYEINLSAKSGDGPYGWRVTSQQDGQSTESDVEVLVWSDIVRDTMATSIPMTFVLMARMAAIYIGSGALWRLMRLRKGPVIAALYPVFVMVLQLVLAIGFGWAVAGLAGLALPNWLAMALGVTSAAGAAYGMMRWLRANDGRFYVYYLVHNYVQSASLYGAYPPQIEARISEFCDLIADAMSSEVDEILVVGHSSGAHFGASVLADLLRSGRVTKNAPALGFLTLGQVMPMVSFLPQAHRLRGDLQYLSTRDELAWVDVSAPGDGCAFALCDPVAVSGVAMPHKKWPLVISAAFSQTLSAARWAELRWRFFRLHFQYLCAFDRPGDYDYFRITAGPLTLRDRFKSRTPSKSRIEEAVSKFTSVAAE